MILQRDYQVNYTILKAGTQIRIVKQQRAFYWGARHCFLMEAMTGEHKGYQWNDYIGNLRFAFGWYKSPAPHITMPFADDYIEAGWSCERIIHAGLVFKNARTFFPQYYKYYKQLKTAETL